MREIKFRVWDADWNKMVYPIGLDWETKNEMIIYYWFRALDKVSKRGIPAHKKAINIMQFTGLCDKNRKEIFECDILRKSPKNDWEKENYSCFEVFFHDNDACDCNIGFQMNRMHNHGSVCGGFNGYKFKPETVKQFEVIGNIFQNPELLNNK